MQYFWLGTLQTVPFFLVMIPFGVVFGIVATEAGMQLSHVIGFSVVVLAGASQFTAVQLLADNAPLIVVLVSSLAVNLLMAMYSASMVPWVGHADPKLRAVMAYALIDQTYALSIQEFEKHPKLSLNQRLGYFFGTSLGCCLTWVISSVIGATIGSAIPDSWSLDFAIPITFLAMIAPMLRSIAHIAATFVSIVGALVFAFLPSGLGLMIAAPLAMITGSVVEVWVQRRAARNSFGHKP